MLIFGSIFGTILGLIILFFVYLKALEQKVNQKEQHIKKLFLERTALIPAIFEVSKNHVNKHDEIFHEILKLRKQEFAEMDRNTELFKLLETKTLIHHEINFIFKICNKHPQLIKEGKFIYLRNLIIKKSTEIGNIIETYKISTGQLNKLIDLKNITIIGLFFPLSKKIEI